MIVTTVTETVRTVSETTGQNHSRSLARRGFFFSETEAFDYFQLAPGAEIGSRGRRGTEEAWFVIDGDGELINSDGSARTLHRYTLAACSLDSGTRLRAGVEGMGVLLVAVIPKNLSTMMPPRLPSEPSGQLPSELSGQRRSPAMTVTERTVPLPHGRRRGIPGATAVHHVAYTVPDLKQAVEFFTNIIGAELVYLLGPVQDSKSDWMTRQLGVDSGASAHIAMLRLGAVTNLELFEYTAPDQRRSLPRNSDWGGHHLAIYVTDIDAAVAYLRAQPDVRILGEPQTITDGPIAGNRWVYFRTPWGMHLELIHLPPGAPYEQRTRARMFLPDQPWSTR